MQVIETPVKLGETSMKYLYEYRCRKCESANVVGVVGSSSKPKLYCVSCGILSGGLSTDMIFNPSSESLSTYESMSQCGKCGSILFSIKAPKHCPNCNASDGEFRSVLGDTSRLQASVATTDGDGWVVWMTVLGMVTIAGGFSSVGYDFWLKWSWEYSRE